MTMGLSPPDSKRHAEGPRDDAVPERLYHYTTAQGLLGIIEGQDGPTTETVVHPNAANSVSTSVCSWVLSISIQSDAESCGNCPRE